VAAEGTAAMTEERQIRTPSSAPPRPISARSSSTRRVSRCTPSSTTPRARAHAPVTASPTGQLPSPKPANSTSATSTRPCSARSRTPRPARC
jgi:hypothetical protein